MASPLVPTDEQDWTEFYRRSVPVGSNGCTGVPDVHRCCCDLHDYAYRTGRSWRTGDPITRKQADASLRDCIRSRSKFGKYSPLSAVMWLGVRLFGGFRGFNGG